MQSTPRWLVGLVAAFVVLSLGGVTAVTVWALFPSQGWRTVAEVSATLAQPWPSTTATTTATATPIVTPTAPDTPTRVPIGTPTRNNPATRRPTTTRALGAEPSLPTASFTPGFFITVPRTTPTEVFPFRFNIQAGYPVYSRYPGGCNWLGFTGQVFDLNGQPLYGLVVRIGGPEYLLLSGNARSFGFNGWLEQVANQPTTTTGFYSLQLQDPLGNALSPTVPMPTFADCARNLITVNFVQINP